MGLDVQIYIKVADGVTDWIRNDTNIEGEFTPLDRSYYEDDEMTFVTHELSSMTRYYSPSYARGPWPQISALLLILLMDERVEKVWYTHDGTEHVHPKYPFTLDELAEINKYYVEKGHSEYSHGERRR